MTLIVVVEDDVDINALVAFKLRAAGHQVLSATDGVTGLELIRSRRPNLVVLDVQIPRLHGLDVCRAVRADSDLAGTFVMLLSAWAFPTDLEAGRDAGADDYLTKPFSNHVLVARVAALLATGRVPRNPTEVSADPV